MRSLSVAKPEKSYPFWQSIMEKCGAKTLDELRALPVDTLFRVWQENKKISMGGGCSPCIDGELIVAAECDVCKRGGEHKIPYMIGTTSHDVVPPILFSMGKKWCKKEHTASYLWFFERNLPGDDNGAWHSSDLWYWFGTLDNCWRPFTDKDRELSNEMSDRLCAFAKNGNPNTDKYTGWESGGGCALMFGDNDTHSGNPSMLKLWKTMFTNEAPGE